MRSAPIPEQVRPKKRIFVPSDFGGILQHIPEGCPLVGGQAVAWWQQQYCPSDAPITSCDIDFWGYREDLDTLARALGQQPMYPHKYDMTIWVGGVPVNLKGEKTLVEFIHTVPGIDTVSAEKASVLQLFSTGMTGKRLLILSPVSLVLAKHGLKILSAVPIQQIRETAAGKSLSEEDRKRLQNFQSMRWPQVVDIS